MTSQSATSAREENAGHARGDHRARRWLVNYPRAIPIALFVIILAITAASVFSIETNARAREEALLRKSAQSVSSALERRANSFSAYLRAASALFATTDTVDVGTFSQFVAELQYDEDYRGAEGIGWAVVDRSAASEVAQLNNRISTEESLRPAMPEFGRPQAQVTFLAPNTARNHSLIGFDLYSDPVRTEAMETAQRTVRPTASGRVVLKGDAAGTTPGFVILMPVFALANDGSANRALAGFVFSSFNARQFLDAAIERTQTSQLGMRLYDATGGTASLLVASPLAEGGRLQVEQPVNVAGREFQLVVQAPPGTTLAPLSMAVLMFGLALGSLLMLLARLLTQQAIEDQRRLAFFEEQHSIRNSLTRELNHRVKNTLANVLSILSLTRRRSTSLDEFADGLEGRIRALSATHDLLTGTDWGTTPIRSVVEAELQHFRNSGDHIISIDGPPLELAPNDALSLGLAIHELATNAAKYGSLSVPDGRVSIYWTQTDANIAELEWHESEGPEVPEDRKRGFGTDLIEKIIAHELKHAVDLRFEREGVRCIIRIPVRRRGEFQIRDRS